MRKQLFLALIPCSSDRNSQLYRPILNLFQRSPALGLCIPMSLNFLRQSYYWEKCAIQTYTSICVTTSSKIQAKSGNVFTAWDISPVLSVCPDHWTWNSSFSSFKAEKQMVLSPPQPVLYSDGCGTFLWGEECEFWIPSGRARNCTRISLIMGDFYIKMRGVMPLGCSSTVLKKDGSVLSWRI